MTVIPHHHITAVDELTVQPRAMSRSAWPMSPLVGISGLFLVFLRAHTHLLILGFSEVFGVQGARIVYILNVLQSAFA
jgi:hypothetical protein